MKSLITSAFVILALICHWTDLSAQKKKILVDVAHGQKFYSDPADSISSDLVPTERLKYMTGELTKNAAAHHAVIGYLKHPLPQMCYRNAICFLFKSHRSGIPPTNAQRSATG